jgi:hypothetical protein
VNVPPSEPLWKVTGVSMIAVPVPQPFVSAVMYVNGLSVDPGEFRAAALSLRPWISSL